VKVYTAAQLKAIIDVVKANLRDHALLLLLLDTAARANEALHIKTEDVDIDRGTILLRTTKNKQHRIVYFLISRHGYSTSLRIRIDPQPIMLFASSVDMSQVV
jgi:integrase